MLSLALILIGGLGSPALGQHHLTGGSAAKIVDALATCTVAEQKSTVVEALATARDYKRDAQVMPGLRGKNCVPDNVNISVDSMVYRGSLARVLVRSRYPNDPAKLNVFPIRETDTWSSIMGFADCVVRADPTAAYKMIRADAGSQEEQEAFAALNGKFDACKPWKTIFWAKDNLISFFSEAYYRASRADTASSM